VSRNLAHAIAHLLGKLLWLNLDLAMRLLHEGALLDRARRLVPGALLGRFRGRERRNGAAVVEARAEPVTRQAPPDPLPFEELADRLGDDRGCADDSAQHDGCAAALELGVRFPSDPRVVTLLEETVTRGGRPHCIQRAGILSLVRSHSSDAPRALGRMLSVTRKRLEWDGSATDRQLLGELEAQRSSI
jgi:hypothetical protein